MAMTADRFSIAFLCTGNRFRSPLAGAFVSMLSHGLPVEVTTASTAGPAGAPALPEAAEIALQCRVDLSDHRSSRLLNDSLQDVDVVIGFEEAHVRRAVVDGAARRSRTFVLPELVRLLRTVDEAADSPVLGRARDRVEAAGRLRDEQPGLVQGTPPIPDPYGRSKRVHLEVARDIRSYCLELVADLFDVADPQLPEIPSNLRARSVSLHRQALRSVRRRLA
jgi:protein-tyrosine-phosphatase